MPRILLVDDDSEIRYLTRMMLEKAGHEVAEAGDSEEGLELLRNDRPDLILLDVRMPGLNGWEVCRKIKADDKLRDIPVVMFTVRTSGEDMKHSYECGAEAHINKPFSSEELLLTVEKLVRYFASSKSY